MTIESIKKLVADDIAAADQLIAEQFHSHIGLIDQLSEHIFSSGGKRIRPLLVLLGAHAFAYTGDKHIALAVAIEFFHTATLLHDDVVDDSSLRRGKQTANTIWGSKASVLVGDYLFTKSFEIMTASSNLEVIELLAHTSNTITKGEVLQLLNCNNPKTSEQRYLEVIKHKTAILFSASAKIGAILTTQDETEKQALADYGLHLGNAFQLVDDALDYCSSSDILGKNIGDDLAEGKPTLPLIYALDHGNPEQQAAIKTAIQQGSVENLETVQAAIQDTKAIDYTYQAAKLQVDHALTALQTIPPSKYRDAMADLAKFALVREH